MTCRPDDIALTLCASMGRPRRLVLLGRMRRRAGPVFGSRNEVLYRRMHAMRGVFFKHRKTAP